MAPRRKKPAPAEAGGQDEAPVSGAGEAKPKKKRVTRAKKTAAPEEGVAPSVSVPTAAAPKPRPVDPFAPTPISIPVRPMAAEAPPAAPKILIEPDIRAGEPKPQDDDLWLPPKKDDADLSTPPRVLLQRRKMPMQEVEDVLEEPEEVEELPERDELRPVVRSGVFRKLALGFAGIAVLLGLVVMYVVYAKATIVIHPNVAEVRTERVLSIVETASGEEEIPGVVAEVTVAGEKTGAPTGSNAVDAVATGFATLINTTDEDQVLVATTRLLSPDQVLFRLKARVNVPAKGRLKTEVYADQAGKASEIGPTRFTIPGLSPSLQAVIYAESDASMTGGVKTTGIVSESDITAVEEALKSELVAQAQAELAVRMAGDWTGESLSVETMNRFVNAAPGETVDGIVVRLTLRVRAVAFDRVKALEAVVKDLERGLTSDRELKGVDGDAATFEVERADPKTGTATVRVAVSGRSSVSLESPLFDVDQLRGLDLGAVQAYFEGIEGVERVDVRFRPFWIKRMPDLADHISFEISEE